MGAFDKPPKKRIPIELVCKACGNSYEAMKEPETQEGWDALGKMIDNPVCPNCVLAGVC